MNTKKTVSVFWGVIILLCVFGFGGYRYYVVSANLKDTQVKLAQAEQESEQTKTKIAELQNSLLGLEQDKENITSEFQNKINDAKESLQELKKLAETDKELLQKYSKVFFLNEHYVPSELTFVDEKYLDNKSKPQQVHSEVWSDLRRMIDRAAKNGVKLTVVSAYRSFGDQTSVKTGYKFTYGAGTANQFSAEQGYSEHQLGTAVDFNVEGATPFVNFENTEAYKWLTENAYKYGFVISYPKGNAYYQFEPWHWRFVGTELSHDLQDEEKFFYDLDQRDIDDYLVTIFD